MRVSFDTAESFIDELRANASAVFAKTVRCEVIRAPQQKEAVTFSVALIAGAIICTDDGDYMAEYQEVYGVVEAGDETPPTDYETIKAACADLGLRVASGKYEL